MILPDIGYASYIAEYAIDIGLTSNTGMSIQAMTWSELNSWCQVRRIKLRNFEIDWIMMLSNEYVQQHVISNEQFVPPPYTEYEVDRKKVADKVGDALRAIAKARKGNAKVHKQKHK